MRILTFVFFSFFIVANGFAQDSVKIENLKTFSKVFGYVRYFHPSDEAANADWNKIAIYGASRIKNCKNRNELLSGLKSIFYPLAPTMKLFFSEEKISFDTASITPPDKKKYETTYWQHRGVSTGMEYQEGPYISSRVNSKELIHRNSKADDFGNVMAAIDANDYLGSKIKFTGFVKLKKGSAGSGHVWLRVDDKENKIGFFNNMDERPVVDSAWKKYEIEGIADSTGEKIVFGFFLSGKGNLLSMICIFILKMIIAGKT